MKIDLCKLLGVEEGEEFKIELSKIYIKDFVYRVKGNKLEWTKDKTDFYQSSITLNVIVNITNIIKLTKKKQFTDDELVIMRNFPSGFDWITRDKSGNVYIFEKKPSKNEYGCWGNGDDYCILVIFNHLFQSILWEDEEPVYIDDYVER